MSVCGHKEAVMWELVIVWAFGEDRTQVFKFETKAETEKAMDAYRMAFGNQVAWAGIRPVYFGGR